MVPSLVVVVVLVAVPFPSDGISVDVNSRSSSSPATSSLSAFTLCLSPAVGYWLLHQVLSELVKLMEEGQILGEQGESFEKRHHIERHHMEGSHRKDHTESHHIERHHIERHHMDGSHMKDHTEGHHIERHHMEGQQRFERRQKMGGQSLLLCRANFDR